VAPPVLAVQLLTAVPLPVAVPAEARHLGRALALFPLVGLVLGLGLAALDRLLLAAFPLGLATVLLLVAATLLTGGLHLDGLMDACDGLFGGRTAERRLEIMRDSRVGSYGVLGGVLQLLLKLAALAALPVDARGAALVTSLVAGRWAMAGVAGLFPPARREGLGAAFKEGASLSLVAVATGLALLVAWLALGAAGLALLGLAAVVALLAGRSMTAKLGGLTGDCYGAVDEVVEATVLIALVAWLRRASGV
jgi:adenosylcobinamide-GDP ribazoletransferase